MPGTKERWEQQSVSRTWLLSLMFPSRENTSPTTGVPTTQTLLFLTPQKNYTQCIGMSTRKMPKAGLFSYTHPPDLSLVPIICYPNLSRMPQKSDTGRCNLMLYMGFSFCFSSPCSSQTFLAVTAKAFSCTEHLSAFGER